jgi:hypothetical protein
LGRHLPREPSTWSRYPWRSPSSATDRFMSRALPCVGRRNARGETVARQGGIASGRGNRPRGQASPSRSAGACGWRNTCTPTSPASALGSPAPRRRLSPRDLAACGAAALGPRRRLGLSRGPRLSGHAKRAAKGTPTAYASASTAFLPPRRRSCCTPLRATPGPGATAAGSRAAPHTGRAAPTENDSAASATTMRAIGARFIFVEMTAPPLQSSSGAAGNQGARLGSFAGSKV